VKYLPVSTASSIFFTQPIWTAMGAYLAIGESLTKYDIISILVAFVGVLIINNPWQDNSGLGAHNEGEIGDFIDRKIYTTTDKIIGSAYSLVGAIGAGSAFVCMRIMRNDIHYSVSPFWFSIGCTFLSPIFSADWMTKAETTTTYTGELVFLISIASIGSFFGQVFQSRAYQLEKAGRVAAFNYLQIVTGFLWDILFFKSHLKLTDIIGSLLIIGTLFLFTILRALGKIK